MDGLDAEIGANRPVEAAPRFGASHALMVFGLMLFGQIAVSIGLFFLAIIFVPLLYIAAILSGPGVITGAALTTLLLFAGLTFTVNSRPSFFA